MIDTKGKSAAEIRAMQQQLADALVEHRAERISALRKEIEELADDDGVSFATFIQQSLLDAPRAARKPVAQRGVAPAKYVNPDDSSVTWSGKGPTPGWFTSAIAQGYSREMLEVATPSRANGNGAHA
jgi:DNA-binding protein H-NS